MGISCGIGSLLEIEGSPRCSCVQPQQQEKPLCSPSPRAHPRSQAPVPTSRALPYGIQMLWDSGFARRAESQRKALPHPSAALCGERFVLPLLSRPLEASSIGAWPRHKTIHAAVNLPCVPAVLLSRRLASVLCPFLCGWQLSGRSEQKNRAEQEKRWCPRKGAASPALECAAVLLALRVPAWPHESTWILGSSLPHWILQVSSHVPLCFGVSALSPPTCRLGSWRDAWGRRGCTHVPPMSHPRPTRVQPTCSHLLTPCTEARLTALTPSCMPGSFGDIKDLGSGNVSLCPHTQHCSMESPTFPRPTDGTQDGSRWQHSPTYRRAPTAHPQRATPLFLLFFFLFQRKPNSETKAKSGRRSRGQSRTRAPNAATPPCCPGFPAAENCTIFSPTAPLSPTSPFLLRRFMAFKTFPFQKI